MASPDGTLRLRYLFTPSPNPIRASGEGNPGSVDLLVMVSPGDDLLTVRSVTIDIPVGDDAPNTLSAATSLPAPTYDQQASWSITSSGESVTIAPAPGASGLLTRAILFTLPGIVPNTRPGGVRIVVTESTSAGKGYDDESYTLEKLPAEFSVVDFRAEPSTLSDPASTVLLKWKCGADGQSYSYSVHTDGWREGRCVDGGRCLTCDDGARGVRTPVVPLSTTFYLDVIETDPAGHLKVVSTLAVPVQVIQPSFAPSSMRKEYLSGRVVRLGWVALNASHCSVAVDDVVIDARAPTNTYAKGYAVALPGDAGHHSLAVTAHAAIGAAESRFIPGDVVVHPSTTVYFDAYPNPVALTPDGSRALVGTGLVAIVDFAASPTIRQVEVGGPPSAITLTADGKRALVGLSLASQVVVLDLETRLPVPPAIEVGNGVYDIAVTRDGKRMLSVSLDDTLTISDVPTRAVTARVKVGRRAGAVAVTPDDGLALVASADDATVSVVELATNTAEPTAIPVGDSPWGIVVTPDGALALVTSSLGNSITVIDIQSRKAEPGRIPVGSEPRRIAVSGDGALAVTANNGGSITVVDVPNRRAVTTIHTGGMPMGVALSQDGMRAAVTSSSDSSVTLL